MNSSAPALRAASAISSNVASGLAAAMLSLTRSAEQEVVLEDDADALSEMDEVDLPAVEAVDPDKPLLHAVEALDEPRDRRLARAALADDADYGAGLER